MGKATCENDFWVTFCLKLLFLLLLWLVEVLQSPSQLQAISRIMRMEHLAVPSSGWQLLAPHIS